MRHGRGGVLRRAAAARRARGPGSRGTGGCRTSSPCRPATGSSRSRTSCPCAGSNSAARRLEPEPERVARAVLRHLGAVEEAEAPVRVRARSRRATSRRGTRPTSGTRTGSRRPGRGRCAAPSRAFRGRAPCRCRGARARRRSPSPSRAGRSHGSRRTTTSAREPGRTSTAALLREVVDPVIHLERVRAGRDRQRRAGPRSSVKTPGQRAVRGSRRAALGRRARRRARQRLAGRRVDDAHGDRAARGSRGRRREERRREQDEPEGHLRDHPAAPPARPAARGPAAEVG